MRTIDEFSEMLVDLNHEKQKCSVEPTIKKVIADKLLSLSDEDRDAILADPDLEHLAITVIDKIYFDEDQHREKLVMEAIDSTLTTALKSYKGE